MGDEKKFSYLDVDNVAQPFSVCFSLLSRSHQITASVIEWFLGNFLEWWSEGLGEPPPPPTERIIMR